MAMLAKPPTTRCHTKPMTWCRSAAPATICTMTRPNPTVATRVVHWRGGPLRSVRLARPMFATARLANAATAACVIARSGANER